MGNKDDYKKANTNESFKRQIKDLISSKNMNINLSKYTVMG